MRHAGYTELESEHTEDPVHCLDRSCALLALNVLQRAKRCRGLSALALFTGTFQPRGRTLALAGQKRPEEPDRVRLQIHVCRVQGLSQEVRRLHGAACANCLEGGTVAR